MDEALAEAVRKLQAAKSARLFPFARYRAIAIVHVVHYNERASGARRVPTFKQFDGFRIEVRSRDHNPPHFHAIGSDFHALIRISDLQVMRGTIFDEHLGIVAVGRRWGHPGPAEGPLKFKGNIEFLAKVGPDRVMHALGGHEARKPARG